MHFFRKIKHFSDSNRSFFFNLMNLIWYAYKRNRWVFDLSRLWRNFEEIKIDRPVFMLGVHGGGLTVISRMIRRHCDFVSVSGNCNYWSGADEIDVVLGSILPKEFAGVRHKIPKETGLAKVPTVRIYATDKFLPYFRNTKEDVTTELKDGLRRIIKWCIHRNAIDEKTVRFTDKSQIYTIRLSFINEILKDTNPKFILVTRNPYVICYRTAKTHPLSYRKLKIDSFEKRLLFAGEHWRNSIGLALEDSKEVESFKVVKFEDFLKGPEKQLKEICNFIEVDFNENMLPQAWHKIPFGSRSYHKWYPLRPNVNEKYLKELKKEHADIIEQIVEPYASNLGYKKPVCESLNE